MLAHLIQIPTRVEALIIILLGILSLSVDLSPLHLRSNLKSISDIGLEKAHYLEDLVKYVLGFIVVARASTHHLFLACHALMLWPVVLEEKASLALPWLLLGILRCLVLNFLSLLTGSFICHKERGLRPICLHFLLSQVIEHSPTVYAWFSILSYYRELAEFSHELSFDDLCQRARAKSLSVSHLDVDALELERIRAKAKDPADVLLNQIRLLVDNFRHVSSRSFDSLVNLMHQREEYPFEIVDGSDLCAKTKAMRVLDITDEDVARIGTGGGRMSKMLDEIGVEDCSSIGKVKMGPVVKSKSFYVKKGEVHATSKSDHLRSMSAFEDIDRREVCLCYTKRLSLKHAASSEREIVSIDFDSTEMK